LCRICPRLQSPTSREEVQDQGVPKKIRKGLVPHKPGGRVPELRGLDLRGPDADSHLPPGLRTGLGLRTRPGLLSGTILQIERQLRTRVSPMHIRPLRPFRLIVRCWSHSLLRPPRQPLPEIRGLLREVNTRSTRSEAIRLSARASGGVKFPEHRVPGCRGRKRWATWRTRLFLLRT
jgi:hypothetical protein